MPLLWYYSAGLLGPKKLILPPTPKKVAYLLKNEEPKIESTKFDQLNKINFNYLIMITWILFYWNWWASRKEIKVLKSVNKLFVGQKLEKVGKWRLFCLYTFY